jgi:hypothetical protein
LQRKQRHAFKVCLILYLLLSFSFFPSRLGVLSKEAERKTLLPVLGEIEKAGLPASAKLALNEKALWVGFEDGSGIYIFVHENERERTALISRYESYDFQLIANYEHIVAYENGSVPEQMVEAIQQSNPHNKTMPGRWMLFKSLRLVEPPRFMQACMPLYTLMHFVTGLFILSVVPGRFLLALPLVLFHPGHFNSLHLQYAYILLPSFWIICGITFWFKFPGDKTRKPAGLN